MILTSVQLNWGDKIYLKKVLIISSFKCQHAYEKIIAISKDVGRSLKVVGQRFSWAGGIESIP